MGNWVIVYILLAGIKEMNNILLRPTFQYSIIPLFHVRVKILNLKNIFIFNKL